MKHSEIENLSLILKALSDPQRLKMLSQICQCQNNGKKVNVGMLKDCCQIDLSVVSRHLSKLKSAGVLRAQKKGKEVFYEMNGNEVSKILRALADFIDSENCCVPGGQNESEK